MISPTTFSCKSEDWLGTRRVLVRDSDLTVQQTCFSLPYGNGETCAPTPTENLFTQHERDAESGNDYFGARYYSSDAGRFLTPDWSAKEEPAPYAELDDPQSLNLYDYVGGNPLRSVDTDGHWFEDIDAMDAMSIPLAALFYGQTLLAQDARQGLSQEQAQEIAWRAQQQGVPAPTGTDPTVMLNFNGMPVTVNYIYGPMPNSPYEGGVDITATPSGCNGCRWSQVYSRTGTGATPPTKDGPGVGPLYGQEGGPANQFKDRPASPNGAVGTFTGTAILGNTNIQGKSFNAVGAMTYSYRVNGKGGVTMPIIPRPATPNEFRTAIRVLQMNSPDWQIH